MEATRFRVTPGRHGAFLDMLRETQAYLAQYGLAVRMRVRSWHVAETATGQVSVQLLFADARIRAAVLDQVRRDGPRNPLARALEAPDPSATLTQRLWLDSTDQDAPTPIDRDVIAYSVFRAVRGHEDEANAAFIEAERRDRQLGADTELWVVRYGSGSFGSYVRGLAFDSFEELRAFDELCATSQLRVTAIDHAVQTGILERVAWALTTAISLE